MQLRCTLYYDLVVITNASPNQAPGRLRTLHLSEPRQIVDEARIKQNGLLL